MFSAQKMSLVAAAVAGIVAGAACSSSNSPPAASAGPEPMGDKNGCKGEAGGKHACTGDMKMAPEGQTPEAPKNASPSTGPAAQPMAPMDGMKDK